MGSAFDRRIIPDPVLAFVRGCQSRAPCHLAGGAALAGRYLGHRLSRDVDLFCHEAGDVRTLVREIDSIARQSGGSARIVRDAGSFVRATLEVASNLVAIDLVHEAIPDIEPPPPPLEGVIVESLADLRANKLTCLLSRSEPRDLVDLLFLDRAGHPPERDLAAGLRKDAGLDPAILAWLLRSFRTAPLPAMLLPLEEAELARFRDELAERFRRLAVP